MANPYGYPAKTAGFSADQVEIQDRFFFYRQHGRGVIQDWDPVRRAARIAGLRQPVRGGRPATAGFLDPRVRAESKRRTALRKQVKANRDVFENIARVPVNPADPIAVGIRQNVNSPVSRTRFARTGLRFVKVLGTVSTTLFLLFLFPCLLRLGLY